MAVLDQVMQLKNQGMDDNQIIGTLQEQGISPNEINNALSQAQIKNAVTADQTSMPNQNYQQPMTQEEYPENYNEDYQQGGYNDENYGEQEYYPQEGYSSEGAGFDTGTIVEIAEQVFSEKIKKIETQLEDLNEFKNLNQTRIDNIDERLKKIESIIDKLQITILEKVGSYGQNLGEIKKEMNMMQDSFGKIVNNIADKNSSASKKRISKKSV